MLRWYASVWPNPLLDWDKSNTGHLHSTVHCVFVAVSTVSVWCDQFIASHHPTDYVTLLLAASPSVTYISQYEAIEGGGV